MKAFKITLLLFFFFCLTGCGYKDVYKKYQSELDNLNCEYVATKNGDYDPYPSKNYKMRFHADENGFYMEVNGDDIVLADKKGEYTPQFGDYTLNFKEENVIKFLDKIKEDGECPGSIFAARYLDDNSSLYFSLECSAGDGVYSGCYLYNLVDSASNVTSQKKSKSKVYNVQSDALNKKVSIQFEYNFDTKKSTVIFENIHYDIQNKYLFTSISQYNKFLQIEERDYDGIFKIKSDSVDWPDDIYLAKDYLIQEQEVLHITVNPDDYNASGGSSIEPEPESPSTEPGTVSEVPSNTEVSITDVSTEGLCRSENLKVPLRYIGWILTGAKIIIPAIIIIFGVIDFFKLIISSKPEEIQKAVQALMMRVIAGVVIFFLPAIINFLFTLVDDFNDYKSSYSECTKCLVDPTSC